MPPRSPRRLHCEPRGTGQLPWSIWILGAPDSSKSWLRPLRTLWRRAWAGPSWGAPQAGWGHKRCETHFPTSGKWLSSGGVTKHLNRWRRPRSARCLPRCVADTTSSWSIFPGRRASPPNGRSSRVTTSTCLQPHRCAAPLRLDECCHGCPRVERGWSPGSRMAQSPHATWPTRSACGWLRRWRDAAAFPSSWIWVLGRSAPNARDLPTRRWR